MSVNAQKAFGEAREHQKAGRLDDAEQIYRQLLTVDPRNADVMHMLGLVAKQKGRYEQAAELIRAAIKRKPHYPEALYNLGNTLRQLGKREEAIAAYRKSISLRPNQATVYGNLGVLLIETGQFEEAIVVEQKATSIDPGFADGYFNLGNALREMGRLEEAIAAFQRTVTLKPDRSDAYHNLGFCLGMKDRLPEAVEAFKRAIVLNPGHCDTRDNLSVALRNLGRLDQAIAVSERAIQLFPDSVTSHCNLGHACYEAQQFDRAIIALRKALALDPDSIDAYQGLSHSLEKQGKVQEAIDVLQTALQRGLSSPIIDFELAAMGVGEAPAIPPEGYMIGLFNEYSRTFDEHLVKTLHYAGPQLLFEAVSSVSPQVPMDIMDLGCGTGLCAESFKPVTRTIAGVDIAPKMIEQARLRGLYGELEVADISVALQKRSRSLDLILAADVFIYVGALEAVFAASAEALRPGGLISFTLENLESGDFVLHLTRRYSHSAGYIRRLASAYGFTELLLRNVVLRTDKEVPVRGMVFVLKLDSDGVQLRDS